MARIGKGWIRRYLAWGISKRPPERSRVAYAITCCAGALCVLALSAPLALAQSPYGVGGYLERPEQDNAASESVPETTETSNNPIVMPGLDHGPQLSPRKSRRTRTETAPGTAPRSAERPTTPAQKPTVAQTPAVKPAAQTPARTADPLDAIIGQMLMVGFQGQKPDEPWTQKLAAQLKSGEVGGVIFLSHNIASPQQVSALTAAFRRDAGEIPPLIAVDQEGGIVQRLAHDKGFAEYPTAGKIGKTNDPISAYTVYKDMAAELLTNGFNLNMGPVADLQRDNASPIIAAKERAFGGQPKHVTAFVKAFCSAHRDAGVLTALKHFPGHGSTAADSHTEAADISKTWSKDELLPYRQLLKSGGADMVMVGHVTHTAMADEPGIPASLSKKAINGLLRDDLGFTGVVISDDLEMAAVAKRYPLENSVVRAINAGADIILVGNQNQPSPDLPERLAAIIKDAVTKGTITRKRLQASYDRIVALKRTLKAPPKAVMAADEAQANKGANPAR